MHQDLYGAIFFPFQVVFFLNEPDVDYTGGEFVLTQQIPRAQSKAIVLKPRKGDMLIITTNFMPIKGSKGYYRAQMRHGVSEVHIIVYRHPGTSVSIPRPQQRNGLARR